MFIGGLALLDEFWGLTRLARTARGFAWLGGKQQIPGGNDRKKSNCADAGLCAFAGARWWNELG